MRHPHQPSISQVPSTKQLLWQQFKTSSDCLPPLITKRSTITNDCLANGYTSTTRHSPKAHKQLEASRTKALRGLGGGHQRFDSLNLLRKSNRLGKGGSLIDDQSYQSSVAQSKRLLKDVGNQSSTMIKSTAEGTSKHQPSLYEVPPDEDLQEEMTSAFGQPGEILTRAERKKDYFMKIHQLNDKKRRKWLIKHGKGHVLDFHDEQIRKLKECFNSLDADGSGSIGIEELEDPLIGLGFAETRQEIQDMIDAVDDDGSGQIEFEEFLTIIKGSNASDKTAKINKFFKDMTTGKLASEGISFTMFVQKMRRDYLKDAIMGDDPAKKEFGVKIMKNVAKQFLQQSYSKPMFNQQFTIAGGAGRGRQLE